MFFNPFFSDKNESANFPSYFRNSHACIEVNEDEMVWDAVKLQAYIAPTGVQASRVGFVRLCDAGLGPVYAESVAFGFCCC